jgi:hypothetical protein
MHVERIDPVSGSQRLKRLLGQPANSDFEDFNT